MEKIKKMQHLIRTFGRKKSRTLSATQKECLDLINSKYGIFVNIDEYDCFIKTDAIQTGSIKIDPIQTDSIQTSPIKTEDIKTDPIKSDYIQKNAEKYLKYKRLWLEIGFGFGDNLIENAAKNKDVFIIGCEPFQNAIAYVIAKANECELENIGICNCDARLVLNYMHNNIERIDILFPDPWPKRRHNKRRLFNYDFLKLLTRVLQFGGMIVFATDNLEYLSEVLVVCKNFNENSKISDDIRKNEIKDEIDIKNAIDAKNNRIENPQIISNNFVNNVTLNDQSTKLIFESDIEKLKRKPDCLLIETKYELKAKKSGRPAYYLQIYKGDGK